MEGKVIAAVGSCAILAGVAYVFQGENKTKSTRKGQAKLFPGLVNLGNTCYLNSVVQALASVATFVLWLQTSCKQNITNKRLANELSKFMQVLNNPNDEQDSYDPTSIFSTLYSYGWVVTREQQDAHEMFQVITSTLADEEDFTFKKNWNYLPSEETNGSDRSSDSIVHRSRVAASKVETKSSSPFTGLFANQLSCKACSKKHSVKFDYFNTISLSLPSTSVQIGNCSLQGLLRKFVCSEIIESFHCESCGKDNKQTTKQTRLLKKISLGKLPYCLCFHINRTYWQNNGIPYKNNTFVNFPEVFDVSPFLYTSSDIDIKINIPVNFTVLNLDDQSEKMTHQDKKEEEVVHTRLSKNTEYHLVAVIVHIGGVNEGHYVTYRRLAGPTNNIWTFVSDETVQIVPLNKVLNSNAYMLFYERKTT